MDVWRLDLEGLIQALENGKVTSEQLIEMYTSRIAQFEDQVRAIGRLNPEAKSIAIERDQQRTKGNIMGKLHGIPILVKDTFITLDKMDTTAGSYALVGAKYKYESTVVTKLRTAGAIILGKTNLSQWGLARSPKCPNGWSATFGQAYGPFHADQDPQGSSSGSAIAASLHYGAACLGAETSGSILYPAQRNSVVGLKPTPGLTSRAGIIPLNPDQDSVGPLAISVKDVALILQIIAGKDEKDEATADIPFDTIPDYVASCNASGLDGLRVAVPQSVYLQADSDPELGVAFRSAVKKIQSLGAIVIEDIEFKTWRPGARMREDLWGDIQLRESFGRFFDDLLFNPHGIHNISELIEFIKTTPEEQYDEYGAEWFVNARDALGSSQSAEYREAKVKMERLGQDVVKLLDEHNCDVLLATSSTDLPLDLGRLPGISVPLGFFSENRPVLKDSKGFVKKGPNIPYAITFAGRRFSEEKLISCAYAFEQATKVNSQNEQKMVVTPSSSPCTVSEA
ncbi:putative amidase [Nemania sp. FL0031]|nr:putative amidase [Nemania sp. FL0031]